MPSALVAGVSEYSRQSQPLDSVAVAALDLADEPLVPAGPVAPSDFVVAGTFFMLREIELTSALTKHVNISRDGQAATWLLPTSKTDPRALGVSRVSVPLRPRRGPGPESPHVFRRMSRP